MHEVGRRDRFFRQTCPSSVFDGFGEICDAMIASNRAIFAPDSVQSEELHWLQ